MIKDQSIVGVLLILAVVCTTITSTHGLYCPVCQDLSHARDCDEVMKCSSISICYHDKIRTASGSIRRRLGCRDRLMTKPNHVDPGTTVLCSEMCSTDMCSVSLCGDLAFQTPRGPLCFHCDKLLSDDCNKFSVCTRDQVCYESAAPSAGTRDVLVTAGCFGKQACQTLLSVFGKRRRRSTTGHYYNCCHDDLCNRHNSSTASVTTTTPAPVVTPAPTTPTPAVINIHASTATPCTDKTELEICKVAGQYVCGDRAKALNANCLHFCGFC